MLVNSVIERHGIAALSYLLHTVPYTPPLEVPREKQRP